MTSLRRVQNPKRLLALLLALTITAVIGVLLQRLRGRGGEPPTEGGWRAEPIPQLVSSGGPELSPN
ncbi:MAG: hypothetical protein KAZ88_00135 [Acidimicrobiia bacterium]|jgi:ribose 1,5-bisphosphokinase PhnN|nr:hypothetical protein [Acidimicrobiia bacterium]MBP8179385.1 hypothetical protein [Acidimicrobiia bacterium]